MNINQQYNFSFVSGENESFDKLASCIALSVNTTPMVKLIHPVCVTSFL